MSVQASLRAPRFACPPGRLAPAGLSRLPLSAYRPYRGTVRTAESRQTLLVYATLLGLLLVVFAAGMKGTSLARPLFIAGSFGVAWQAWRVRPGLHAEVVVILFAFAAFLRRVVDSHAGFNASGIMLVGPLLALSVALPTLRTLLLRRDRNLTIYAPYFVMLVCLLYAWALSAFQNNLFEASIDLAKSLIPLFYAMYLLEVGDRSKEILQGAARAFLFVGPIIGVYGVLQYLNPPEWDRYWMIYSQMKSIGTPEPRQVRVFSTMNSPVSFAMFATCGLLLFGFCRRGVLPVVLAMPLCIALLLTAVRTAWIAGAIGLFYCFFFNATRNRAVLLTLSLLGAGAALVLLTPIGDAVAVRLASLGTDPSDDGSGHARLQQYIHVYSSMDHYLFGNGFGNKVRDAKLMNNDGQFIASAIAMGIFIGNIHVLAVIWAAVQGLVRVRPGETPVRLVAAAVVLGYVCVLPLLFVTGGEIAFLFWMFVGVLPLGAASRFNRPAGPPSPLASPALQV